MRIQIAEVSMEIGQVKQGVLLSTCLFSPFIFADNLYQQAPVNFNCAQEISAEITKMLAANKQVWLTPHISGNEPNVALVVMNGKNLASNQKKYSVSHPICPMKPKQKAKSSQTWNKGKNLSNQNFPGPMERSTVKPKGSNHFPGVMWTPKK